MIDLAGKVQRINHPLQTHTQTHPTNSRNFRINWFSAKGDYKREIYKNNTSFLHYIISLKHNGKNSQ